MERPLQKAHWLRTTKAPPLYEIRFGAAQSGAVPLI